MNNDKTKPTFMIGSDPECIIRSLEDGSVQSALDHVEGSKEVPLQLVHGSIQADNINVEFNSKPSATVELFIQNHNLILSEVEDYLSARGLFMDKTISSVIADKHLLNNPMASMGGCSSDFNVWEGGGFRVNPKPNYNNNQLRAAGGHLHISTSLAEEDDDKFTNRVKLGKALDLVLGVPSVVMDTNGSLRRTIYGKAGAVRYKLAADGEYDGLEYRVLSNFWLQSDALMAWAFNGVKQVIENLDEWATAAEYFKPRILLAINHNRPDVAEQLIDEALLITA